MADRFTVRVHGFTEFMQAANAAPKETKQKVRASFKKAGEVVRADAVRRFSAIDSGSAIGYRTSVKLGGVAVYQAIRKTTGQRGDYGSLQMRKALLPALMHNQEQLMADVDKAMEEVAAHFETVP